MMNILNIFKFKKYLKSKKTFVIKILQFRPELAITLAEFCVKFKVIGIIASATRQNEVPNFSQKKLEKNNFGRKQRVNDLVFRY